MFYQATNPETGRMWDTWLFWHAGTHYLYYLANRPDCRWDNISMATAADGVHWREIGPVLTKDERVTWMGTGSVWKSPNFARDGKFQTNFSWEIGPRQTIWFAESADLVHWTPFGPTYEFVQDERWYERNGRWDCIWTIARPGGGLYGYWTASPKPETGGQFGFGETLDGVTWTALPPPKVDGVGVGEVGAIEKIGDKYYMMFGSGGHMWTLVADSPEGPFRTAAKNAIILHAGPTYFSRFYPTPGGLLVNHHAIARNGDVSMAPLKAARLDTDGTLRLHWWTGNEAMKHEPRPVALAAAPDPATGLFFLEPTLDAGRGVIIEGSMALPRTLGARTGWFIACAGERHGAMLLNADGRVEFGDVNAALTAMTDARLISRDRRGGDTVRFRLLLQGVLAELYLDDALVECFALPAPAAGRLGLLGDGTRDLRVWHW